MKKQAKSKIGQILGKKLQHVFKNNYYVGITCKSDLKLVQQERSFVPQSVFEAINIISGVYKLYDCRFFACTYQTTSLAEYYYNKLIIYYLKAKKINPNLQDRPNVFLYIFYYSYLV